MPSRDRIPALDTLRAFAISWVILLHFGHDGFLPPDTPPAVLAFVAGGSAGVDLFFVLSGYLIGGIAAAEVARTGRLNVARFWFRRWMRTLPAYYVVLATVLTLDTVVRGRPVWPGLWSYALFWQTYAVPTGDLRFAWSWSLCVEELFYLTLPVLMDAAARAGVRPRTAARAIAGVALATAVGGRAYQAGHELPTGFTPGYFIPHCRLDGLAVGLVVATLPRPSLPLALVVGPAGLAAGVGLAMEAGRGDLGVVHMQQFMPISVAFGLAVWASQADTRWRRLELPGAASVAALSYALYLVHLIFLHPSARPTLDRLIPGGTLVGRTGGVLVLITGTAVALRYGVERPFLRLRDRPGPARGGQAVGQPVAN